MIFSNSTLNMQQLQSDLYKMNNQISAQRRVLTPSDDPIASAQALVVSQNQSVNTQFSDNQGEAASQLSSVSGTLSAVSDLIINVQEQVTKATNPNLDDKSRVAIAAEIRQRYDELLGLANSADGMGQHSFAGFRSDTQPFTAVGTPGNRTVSYAGDGGQRQIQVASGRMMDVSESGSAVFMRVPQGNGQFMVSAGATNGGTGVVDSSSVISGYDGSTYKLTFTSANTYTLDVTTNGATTSTPGQSYTAGSQIVLGSGGQQIKIAISGAPAVGDTFTVAPSTNQDVFKTLDDMIKALESNVSASDANKAAFNNQMSAIKSNLGQALNNVLNVQTSVGARQVELDSLTSVSSDLNLQYSADLTKLEGRDEQSMTKIISDMASQKTALDAAMLSFTQISKMSLFNYL
jgi:flagellar hook-associated protein 3 FlgL